MKILLDECIARKLKFALLDHEPCANTYRKKRCSAYRFIPGEFLGVIGTPAPPTHSRNTGPNTPLATPPKRVIQLQFLQTLFYFLSITYS